MATIIERFGRHLASKTPELVARLHANGGAEPKLRDLWELSQLSANDFAEEVARFYALRRITLPQMMAASPLTARFSRRFLRETLIFPYQIGEGAYRLAVADPNDEASVRAAEIVLGHGIEMDVASFEDITTVLDRRLGDDESGADPVAAEIGGARAEDDIESLRDLASGAPVVRAVNDLMWRLIADLITMPRLTMRNL